ncbi:MAG: hypothetical protein WB696_20480 [Chthoniobacterales bacterium]
MKAITSVPEPDWALRRLKVGLADECLNSNSNQRTEIAAMVISERKTAAEAAGLFGVHPPTCADCQE